MAVVICDVSDHDGGFVSFTKSDLAGIRTTAQFFSLGKCGQWYPDLPADEEGGF